MLRKIYVRNLQTFLLSYSVHYTRLKKFASYKHSSVLWTPLNYGHQKFYDTLWKIYVRSLKIFVLSYSVC